MIIFVSVASVGFIVYKTNQSKQEGLPATERFNEPPKITNYFADGLPLKLNITKGDFDFPDKLPYLTQDTKTPFTQDEINKISSSLGFNFDPLRVTDIKDGNILIWNSDNQSLLVAPKIRKVKIVPPTSPRILIQNAIDKKLTEDQYKALGDEFLSQRMPLTPENLKFMDFVYLKIENGLELFRKTLKENSEFVQLNYYQNPLEYPLLSLNPQDSQVIIQFLKDGSILNFEATLPTGIVESPNEYPIKSFEEFTSSINKGILVSLNDGNINLPDIKKSEITNININKISLAYLIDEDKGEIIQPVFLLEGNANVSGYAADVSAQFYLPAFSQLAQP